MLSPALNAVTGFVGNRVAPVFKSVFTDTILPTVSNAFNGVRNAWNNVLSPALSNVSSYVGNTLAPAFRNAFTNTIQPAVQNAFNGISNAWNYVASPAFSRVRETVSNLGTSFSNIFSGMSSTASNVWSGITSTITGAISNIGSWFRNANWTLPHVSLPHFQVSWQTFGPVSLPYVSIQWYKKAMEKAMVLDSPTLFGYSAATGSMLAGGEAGREVVSGEAHLVGLIGDVVAAQNRELYGYIGQLSDA